MATVDPTILALYQTLDLIGVVLNGAIGGSIARQRNFDIIGFAFLALFSALGGGMLRDTLMQRGTPAAIAEPMYMGMAILGGLLAMVIHLKGRAWELFRVHGDAIILGVWAVTGTTKALTYGMPWASAMFMGMLTAVGGGMIRDIATGSIPSIFGGNTLYATRCGLCHSGVLAGMGAADGYRAGASPAASKSRERKTTLDWVVYFVCTDLSMYASLVE